MARFPSSSPSVILTTAPPAVAGPAAAATRVAAVTLNTPAAVGSGGAGRETSSSGACGRARLAVAGFRAAGTFSASTALASCSRVRASGPRPPKSPPSRHSPAAPQSSACSPARSSTPPPRHRRDSPILRRARAAIARRLGCRAPGISPRTIEGRPRIARLVGQGNACHAIALDGTHDPVLAQPLRVEPARSDSPC